MSEVLLSRPLLESIGFNLKDHLSTVRDTFHDSDFSHIGFSADSAPELNPPLAPSKLASVLIRANEQLGTAAPLDSSVELSPLRQGPIAARP